MGGRLVKFEVWVAKADLTRLARALASLSGLSLYLEVSKPSCRRAGV